MAVLAVAFASALRLRSAVPPKAPTGALKPPACAQQAADVADVAELAMREALANPSDASKRGAAVEAMGLLVSSLREVTGSFSQNDTHHQKVLKDLGVLGQVNITHRDQAATQKDLAAMSVHLKGLISLAREASSRHLNDLLQSAANEAKQGTPQDFLRTLRLCSACSDFLRVGEPNDGGYIMCADGLANSGLLGAYSYGINGFDGWGMGVASMFGVPLYEYDCFDQRVPAACPGCQVHFYPQCVEGNYEAKTGAYATMTQQLQHNGHAAVADSTLLLKLDVEGAEWPVYSQEHAATLRKFRQITTELHGIGAKAYDPISLKAMQNVLAAGFSVVHLHGNNNAGTVAFGQYSVPDVLEVTLIRSTPGAVCANYAPTHIPQDQPCAAHAPEASNPVLPQ